MNRLHTYIGQLIGNNIIGMPHGDAIFYPHDLGVGTGEMVLLVDHRLVGVYLYGDLAESHLTIPPIECPHDPFRAFGIAGSDTEHFAEIDPAKLLMDTLINGKRFVVVVSTQIDKTSVDPVVIEDID